MPETPPTFRYVEYTGPDAGEVLINILVQVSKLELDAGTRNAVHDMTDEQDQPSIQGERIVGFQPNPEEIREPNDDD